MKKKQPEIPYRVYAQTDANGNIIDAIRGPGVVIPKDELWRDVTGSEHCHQITEVDMQKRLKVNYKHKCSKTGKRVCKLERKCECKIVCTGPRYFKANGKDSVEVHLECVDGCHEHPIEVQVNGKKTYVKLGEKVKITSDAPQRIGVRVTDPNVYVENATVFLMAANPELPE